MFLQKRHLNLMIELLEEDSIVLYDIREADGVKIKLMQSGNVSEGLIDPNCFEYLRKTQVLVLKDETPYQKYYALSDSGREELQNRGLNVAKLPASPVSDTDTDTKSNNAHIQVCSLPNDAGHAVTIFVPPDQDVNAILKLLSKHRIVKRRSKTCDYCKQEYPVMRLYPDAKGCCGSDKCLRAYHREYYRHSRKASPKESKNSKNV
jgi:DNA-binding PadR family transcriptional regulator